jgi:hypothetical protein
MPGSPNLSRNESWGRLASQGLTASATSPTKSDDFRDLSVKGTLIYSLQDLFEEFKKRKDNAFIVRCSYFEIYNDQIYDLLANIDEFGEAL